MIKRTGTVLILLLFAFASISAAASGGSELFESVQPHVAHLKLKQDDLRSLVEGRVIARALSSKNDKEMSALGAVMADASPEAFIQSYRTLATFKQNPYFLALGTFGATPTLADLDGLTIDDKDLYSLSRSALKDSDVKLTQAEIARIKQVAGPSPRLTPQMKARLAAEYKKILVERVKAYLSGGAGSLGIYADKQEPIDAAEAFGGLIKEQSESAGQCPHIFDYLETYPKAQSPDTESFVYWAKQKFGELKPVINIVHVVIHRDGNRLFIASKQIYSSHYTEAGLSVAEMIPFTDAEGQPRTVVVYTLRLQVDMLGGSLGFMKKRMAQPKVVATFKESLGGLRDTIESLSRAAAESR